MKFLITSQSENDTTKLKKDFSEKPSKTKLLKTLSKNSLKEVSKRVFKG